MKSEIKSGKVGRYIITLIFLFILWVLLTSTLAWEELTTGLIFSAVIAIFGYNYFTTRGLSGITLKGIFYFFLYIPVFFWEMIKANFDVAYRVVHPKMPIKPGIVQIKTTLKPDIAKLILGNSITLTPGTLTVEIAKDNLLIHWINVKAEDIPGATDIIGKRFEKYLKVIFK
ncbi:MAG: Na+/H+ antiporter subunit E [Candidatus Aerophobetes bacterium]|nr:Na+/H+ antiporter subunit E [Candidatus Aerophobetes bacterium]